MCSAAFCCSFASHISVFDPEVIMNIVNELTIVIHSNSMTSFGGDYLVN